MSNSRPQPDPETYSQTDLEELFAEFAIATEHHAETVRVLEHAAASWRRARPEPDDQVPPAKLKSSLGKVAKLADQLTEALSALPAQAAVNLEMEYIRTETALAMTYGLSPNRKGVAIYIEEPDGTEFAVTLELHEISEIIAYLGEMAQRAADKPAGRTGAKRDEALRWWVLYMDRYWTRTLGRKFTRDVTSDGVPISEAARFCVSAFEKVCPDTPSSRVLNEMRHCIRDKRNQTT